jgi:hypothetical protein
MFPRKTHTHARTHARTHAMSVSASIHFSSTKRNGYIEMHLTQLASPGTSTRCILFRVRRWPQEAKVNYKTMLALKDVEDLQRSNAGSSTAERTPRNARWRAAIDTPKLAMSLSRIELQFVCERSRSAPNFRFPFPFRIAFPCRNSTLQRTHCGQHVTTHSARGALCTKVYQKSKKIQTAL